MLWNSYETAWERLQAFKTWGTRYFECRRNKKHDKSLHLNLRRRTKRDFQISFSNRDTSRNALKSSLRKFYGRNGYLIKQYEVSLSQMLNDILWPDHMQWQPPTDQTLYRTRPFTEFWDVSIEHLRRVWHTDRGRLLLRTPGPVPFWTCICSICWDQRHSIPIRHYTSLLYLTFHQTLVSIEHMQRVLHADRERSLLRTPSPVPLGLAYVLLV